MLFVRFYQQVESKQNKVLLALFFSRLLCKNEFK